MKDFIAELKWRGMIHDYIPGIEEQLKKEMTSTYIGFDPTAPSLHIGNLATVMLLKHAQLAGHKPFILVGGATGMIGDPSGKSEERNLLDEEVLRFNQEKMQEQLSRFLDFECEPNSAQVVNNYDWFKDKTFLDFLRDAGKHISVNYMMAKESVKSRLESGISFTEFSYQLLQAYDFYQLFVKHQVKLQMGGSDQWGNITTGTELIRRKGAGEAFALTTPLVTRSDGKKFGKTEDGNVWLDPEMTSPYKFYQFWLNCSDEDSSRLIKVFTLLGQDEITSLEEEHKTAPHQRPLQKAMAAEITTRVHGEHELDMAVTASSILFGKSTTKDLASLDEKTLLAVFEGVPQVDVSQGELKNPQALNLLTEITKGEIFNSKSEARRMIQGGAVSINRTKVGSPDEQLNFQLLQDKYILVQKGKKNYYLLRAI